jgi:hypothetical protein
MNESQMKAIAIRVTAEIVRGHAETEDERRALSRTLPPAFLAVMLEVKAQTVEEIATVIEQADPPQPGDAADAPRFYAAAVRSAFGARA